jgi:hypothetical protein
MVGGGGLRLLPDVADAVDPPVDEDLDLPFWDDPLSDAGI